MRIADIRTFTVAARLSRPFVTAVRSVSELEYFVVEVELTDGSTGQGTAAPTMAVTGESIESMNAAVQGTMRAALSKAETASLNAALDAVADACVGNRSAKAALDVALHDAWTRSIGLPLVEWLGGGARSTLCNDMTISLGSPEETVARARDHAAEGYDVLKLKVGGDRRRDQDCLLALHEALPDCRLRLDANQGWSAKSAVRVISRLEEAGIPMEFVEQPVAAEDITGLAQVTRSVETPIMADESVCTPKDAAVLANLRAADMFNIKLAKCGGIRQAVLIAGIAGTYGIECMAGSMMEPRVSVAAAAHLAAAHPAITMIDLDAPLWFTSAEPSGGFSQSGAELALSGGPGLGLAALVPATGTPA